MSSSRFVVGIDLGTTNSALAFADSFDGYASVRTLKVPQLKAPGEIVESDLLPSFAWTPDAAKLPEGSLRLPWGKVPACVSGLAARDCGSQASARFVSSAKSWLCHPGVDRRAKILPWGIQGAPDPKSPVEISRLILEHLRDAWNFAHPDAPLSKQEIAITVPASFDEVARELTIEAAQQAGLHSVNIMEEPLAAFYAWLDAEGEAWREKLLSGESALVVDVGGGTSDFSIVTLGQDGALSRGAAGDHLLLGGDNVDMAIARRIESSWGRALPPDEWSTLCQLARDAKERIFAQGLDEVKISLLSKGSSVIASAKSASLRKEELLKIVEEGFLPAIGSDSPAEKRGAAIKRMGLPYESDPAITRHLLEFLRYASKMMPGAKGASRDGGPFRPDKILFNGGALIPESLRNRIVQIVGSWFPSCAAPVELRSKDLSLAVAIGSAKALAARHGAGVRVRSGTVRSYYVEAAGAEAGAKSFVCVMPRGSAESERVSTPRKFLLEANKPVSFPLWSAHARPDDKAGDELKSDDGLLHLSSLVAIVRRPGGESFEAQVSTELSSTGMLELSIEASDSKQRWPLKFDIRAPGEAKPETSNSGGEMSLDSATLEKALAALEEAFAEGAPKDASLSVAKRLESLLELPRRDWPLQALRLFCDSLLDELELPAGDAARESRLLNLCGFCLRPGIGELSDPGRIGRLWKLWLRGLANANDPQAEAEWWVLWRRVAPGLRQGQQRTVFQTLWSVLCPKGEYASKLKKSPQVKTEMWRCFGSLELMAPDRKTAAGEILAARGAKLEPYELWVLGRLGARRLFHAPASGVVPAKAASEWLGALIASTKGDPSKDRLFAVSRLAALCGDRALDLPPEILAEAKEFLSEGGAPAQWIKHLESAEEESAEESAGILGDSLPLGLKLLG